MDEPTDTMEADSINLERSVAFDSEKDLPRLQFVLRIPRVGTVSVILGPLICPLVTVLIGVTSFLIAEVGGDDEIAESPEL